MDALFLYYGGMVAAMVAFIATVAVYGVYCLRLQRLPEATRHDNLQSRIERLAADLEQLEARHGPASAAALELAQAREEAEQVIAKARQLQSFLAEHGDRAEEVKALIRQQEQVAADLQRDRERQQQLLAEAAQLAAQAQAAKADLAAAEARSQTLQNEARACQVRITDGQERVALMTREQAAAEQQLSRVRHDLTVAEQRCQDLHREVESLQRRRIELEGINAELEIARSRLESLLAQIETEQKLHHDLLGQTGRLSDLILPAMATRLQDLHRPYLSLGDQVTRRDAVAELHLLGDFGEALAAAGLVFSDRVVKAFHTSLKTADLSPLVVLAGISGTGKSLLPKLYAQFFGMHFLPIAVQPRWDSPQDLFGFYNYMENRFKATELSRLLWQLDHYNNPAADAAAAELQQGMALVLLDEMNLARVEYYFSELLSKLEFRRNVAPDDPEQRRIAEIEIEAGALSVDDRAIRLFVGPNVLFVGTMNEDETTQTLSDKVVDRANVLRFGKPAAAGPLTADAVTRQQTWLPTELWQSWHVPSLAPAEQQRLREDLRRLNDALVRVGRPFGYRIQQAVEAYIANYPGQGAPVFNDALADQLEQKIIPKLVGLDQSLDDLDPVLSEFRLVIEALEDRPLLEAFENAAAQPIFQWRGVHRDSA